MHLSSVEALLAGQKVTPSQSRNAENGADVAPTTLRNNASGLPVSFDQIIAVMTANAGRDDSVAPSDADTDQVEELSDDIAAEADADHALSEPGGDDLAALELTVEPGEWPEAVPQQNHLADSHRPEGEAPADQGGASRPGDRTLAGLTDGPEVAARPAALSEQRPQPNQGVTGQLQVNPVQTGPNAQAQAPDQDVQDIPGHRAEYGDRDMRRADGPPRPEGTAEREMQAVLASRPTEAATPGTAATPAVALMSGQGRPAMSQAVDPVERTGATPQDGRAPTLAPVAASGVAPLSLIQPPTALTHDAIQREVELNADLAPREPLRMQLNATETLRQAQMPAHTRADMPKLVAAQVTESIRQAPGEQRIEVILQPKELGRVKLSLSGNEAAMTVSVSVDRAETLDLLKRNISLLAEEFRELGYQNASFSFDQGAAGDDRSDRAPGGHDPAASVSDTANHADAPANVAITRISVSDRVDIRL